MTDYDGTLRSLPDVRPLYFLPNEPLAEEVLIPAFKIADRVDCMTGFFTSEALASLAPGLATFLNNSNSPMRLIVSPLLTPEDQAAIEDSMNSAAAVAQERLADLVITEDLLQLHTLKCLSWLLASSRLQIKIAFMKNAMFHPKVWIFRSTDATLAVHGSSNATLAGLTRNIEQVAVAQSWLGPNDRYMTDKLSDHFEQLYDNQDDYCLVVDLPRAVRAQLLKTYRSHTPPTEDDFRELYRKAAQISDVPRRHPHQRPGQRVEFAIPANLRYTHGPFKHQGQAVDAWCAADHRGVLEMATGSGKTIAAMICAHRLHTACRPLLVVVAAPYIPLIRQWCDEIASFNLTPVDLTTVNGARARARELGKIRRRLRTNTSDIEVVVVSHDTLCNDVFVSDLRTVDATTLLVADEVHNLGRPGFVLNPPSFFDYRLGLSATPVRQYDDEGTAAIFSFFGPVVFEFPLSEAIGRCLVEYDYQVHPVTLTADEMERWRDLTEKIKSNTWRKRQDPDDDYLMRLLRDRRALLESATNKVTALDEALGGEDIPNLRHTLVYASDKAPEQLRAVNALLNSRRLLFRQLTYQETADHDGAAQIIQSFQDGILRILTAKRVLDEGVNIPQVRKAFILASTTVERQWIQRRGRLLRKCPEIGKTHAEIHDFVALPPFTDTVDDDIRTLVRSELTRLQEFASLARNAGRPDGPLHLIRKLADIALT